MAAPRHVSAPRPFPRTCRSWSFSQEEHRVKAPTISELRSGPPMVDLLTAAAAIGVGRTRAYELAKQGKFPVPIKRVGTTYRVPVTELLRYLHAAEALG
jgi:predicted DNA-binding transcriptional regulator AlpA